MRTALAIAALLFLPGIPLAGILARRIRDAVGWLATAGALGLLWSAIFTLLLVVLRLPLSPGTILAVNLLPAVIVLAAPPRRRLTLGTLRALTVEPGVIAIEALTVAVLAIPLLTVQQGLPTGDVQKSIVWAQRIIETNALPHYQEALAFNRDPADFAIPGLHALTASLIVLTGDPLRSSAWFSLAAAALLPGLAAAAARLLAPQLPLTSTLAFLFTVSNPRFLRFVIAPGYHYQNLVGEIFLVLGFLFLLSAFGGRGHQRSLFVTLVATAALPLVHQFTAFLALLVYPVLLLTLAFRYRGEILSILTLFRAGRRRLWAGSGLLLLVAGASVLTVGTGLGKIPHLFTSAPHLQPSVVPVRALPFLLGFPFSFLAIAGLLVVTRKIHRRELDWRWSLVLLWLGLFFFLSQGARWVIDIPSARTAFYLVFPLSLVAAAGVAGTFRNLRLWWPRAAHFILPLALVLVLASTAGAALNSGLQSIDHKLQANATLTPAGVALLEFLQSTPPRCDIPSPAPLFPAPCADRILIDDWNQRRLTWTILSPYHMVTRVGADLTVIAREAGQSRQRRQQYETLLDFEKIFSLGNDPVMVPLLARHGIAFLATANGLSTDALERNPALTAIYRNEETTVFRPVTSEPTGVRPDSASAFLLERTTLANDIGDSEDVFAHLPVSLLAPQISEIRTAQGRTVRDVRSSVSSIGLNIGAYIPELWDGDGNRIVDQPVTLLLVVEGNGASGRVTRGTTVFGTFALPEDHAFHSLRVHIPAGQLPIDEQGLAFVTLRLDQAPLRVDLVAAGF